MSLHLYFQCRKLAGRISLLDSLSLHCPEPQKVYEEFRQRPSYGEIKDNICAVSDDNGKLTPCCLPQHLHQVLQTILEDQYAPLKRKRDQLEESNNIFKPEAPYQCNKCHSSCATKEDLARHKQTRKELVCSACKVRFNRYCELRDHKKEIHQIPKIAEKNVPRLQKFCMNW